MVSVTYNIGVRAYRLGISLASLFGNVKAIKWIKGREGWKKKLKEIKKENKEEPLIWFHASSLGEFEQLKPLIEQLKSSEEYSNHIVFVTFFSPSGYENSLAYPHADYYFYLPLDTENNAIDFISILQPDLAVFVKYDFWFNYLNNLQTSQVPILYFSCNFRANQIYFKSYTRWQRSVLQDINAIYTLNESSLVLLKKQGFKNASICGDTRYDKVIQNAEQSLPDALIESFKGESDLLILGSSWQPEEKIISNYLVKNNQDLKIIIAPHDISEKHLLEIEKVITVPMLRYSELNQENARTVSIVLIDNIGTLANTYQYSDFAFIGGGFTNDLHNILEAAAFGNVVFYGNKFSKYPEGQELVDYGGGISVASFLEFETKLNQLLGNKKLRESLQAKSRAFIYQHKGATNIVFEGVKALLS